MSNTFPSGAFCFSQESEWPRALWMTPGWSFGGSLVEVSSADYSIDTEAGVRWLRVTTGASNRTITFPSADECAGMIVHAEKIDSGSGHAVLSGTGYELWHQGAWYEFYSDGASFIRIGSRSYLPAYGALLSSYDPASSPTTYTCTGARTLVPPLTRAVAATLIFQSTTASVYCRLRNTGGTSIYCEQFASVVNESVAGSGIVPLDSNLDFDLFASNSAANSVTIRMAGYFP